MSAMEAYGTYLRKTRENCRGGEGVSLRELARYLEITPTYLSDIERGFRSPLPDDVNVKIADYIGVDASVLQRLAAEERLRHALAGSFPNLSEDAIRRMVKVAMKDLNSEG